MIRGLSVLVLGVLIFSGCAMQTETNQLIAQSNASRYESFTSGMVACGENAACQVAVSMGFAGNIGQHQFYKEDSVTDYMKASIPLLGLGVDVARLYKTTTSGDAAGFVITGDNNQISGTANKLTADHESSIDASFDSASSIEHYAYTQDGTKSSSNGSEGSIENVENQQDSYAGDVNTKE